MSYRSFPVCRTIIPVFLSTMIGLAACTPTMKVEAPDKPIVINLNVKIEHEVRVKVENDLDKALSSNPNLF